jgi:hypothetical protein
VPLAALAPQQTPAQQQILARPWLPPRAQTRLRVPGQRRTYRLEPARRAEGAFVRRTRRAAEQWK